MTHNPLLLRQIALFVTDPEKTGDTRVLAREFGMHRSTVYDYLSSLREKEAIVKTASNVYRRGPGWSAFFDGIDSGAWDPQIRPDSDARLAGATSGRISPSGAVRLDRDPRLERAGFVFYLISAPSTELVGILKPLATDAKGNPASWTGERRYPMGTAQFYVGKGHGKPPSVVLHFHKLWFPAEDVLQKGKVDHMAQVFAERWARTLEADFGIRLTPKGVPLPDAKAEEAQEPLRTGHLEWSLGGIRAVRKETLSPTTQVDNSPQGPGKEPQPSIAEVDQAKARETARFAIGGGFDAVMAAIMKLTEATAKIAEGQSRIAEGQERMASSVQMLAESIALQASQGPGPQPGGRSPSRRDT